METLNILKQKSLSIMTSEFFLVFSFLIVTIFNNIGLAVIFIIFFFIILQKNKVYICNEDFYIVFLFYLQFFISFIITSIPLLFILKSNYVEFYPGIFGRLVNIILYFTIFLFIIDERNRKNISTKILFKAYTTGCYILLFFGLWQILNMLFNIPYPNFITRSDIHSVNTSNLFSFFKIRITSIAQEPAYLIPYLIDAIIILFYTSKNYLSIFLITIVIFFTLSLSGYTNLFLIAIIILIFMKNTKLNIAVKILFLFLSASIIYFLSPIILIVIQRFNPDVLFSSSRLQEMTIPLNYMLFDAPVFCKIFGFGPKGMGYLSSFLTYHSGWLTGENITVTTHFIFIDFFVEHGIFGLLIIIYLFYYLFILSTKVYIKTNNRLAQVLFFNLFITSLYTSDYASPRFTIILIFLLCLYKDAIWQNGTKKQIFLIKGV